MGCSSTNENIHINNNYFDKDRIVEFDKIALNYHNKIRKKHEAHFLKLSEDLRNKAQEKVEALMKKINYMDDNDNEFGENLFICDENLNPRKIEDACKTWYDEKNKYNFLSNKYQKGTAHFTQMVWKETKDIGFGYGKANGKNYFLALYSPCGNELFCFKDNVIKDK